LTNVIGLTDTGPLILSTISLVVGGAMSLLLIKTAQSLFAPIKTLDAAVLVSMALLLLIAALLASYFPARRASAIGPLEAIRYE
jgi:putative ABC transport system permease protein